MEKIKGDGRDVKEFGVWSEMQNIQIGRRAHKNKEWWEEKAY